MLVRSFTHSAKESRLDNFIPEIGFTTELGHTLKLTAISISSDAGPSPISAMEIEITLKGCKQASSFRVIHKDNHPAYLTDTPNMPLTENDHQRLTQLYREIISLYIEAQEYNRLSRLKQQGQIAHLTVN